VDAAELDGVRALAREAHAGQIDKLGREYFTAHLAPIATGLREFGPEAEAAGWRHDIIEDTQHTGDTLRSAGVPEDVVAAVESVTKIEGETRTSATLSAPQHWLSHLSMPSQPLRPIARMSYSFLQSL